MTREEEANKASISYASQMCDLCLDEYCKKMGLVCPQFKEFLSAFSEGIKWADDHPKNNDHSKNVWHPASEEPSGEEWRIICQDEEGKFWIKDWADVILLYNTWNTYVTIEKLVKWAYIDELIKE